MSSPTTVFDLSPIPNTCKTTPPPVGLPLSSTPSSSQTETTPSCTKSLSKQSTDNEMEENSKIVTEFDEATCITSIATHVYVSKHAILIAKLFGDSTELSRFDSLHVELKSKDGKIEV